MYFIVIIYCHPPNNYLYDNSTSDRIGSKRFAISTTIAHLSFYLEKGPLQIFIHYLHKCICTYLQSACKIHVLLYTSVVAATAVEVLIKSEWSFLNRLVQSISSKYLSIICINVIVHICKGDEYKFVMSTKVNMKIVLQLPRSIKRISLLKKYFAT